MKLNRSQVLSILKNLLIETQGRQLDPIKNKINLMMKINIKNSKKNVMIDKAVAKKQKQSKIHHIHKKIMILIKNKKNLKPMIDIARINLQNQKVKITKNRITQQKELSLIKSNKRKANPIIARINCSPKIIIKKDKMIQKKN